MSRETPHTIDVFRQIVESHAYQELDGTLVDIQTANCICTIHDALSEERRPTMFTTKEGRHRTAGEIGTLAWQCYGAARSV